MRTGVVKVQKGQKSTIKLSNFLSSTVHTKVFFFSAGIYNFKSFTNISKLLEVVHVFIDFCLGELYLMAPQ